MSAMCPLLSICSSVLRDCQEESCSWWNHNEGECGICALIEIAYQMKGGKQ